MPSRSTFLCLAVALGLAGCESLREVSSTTTSARDMRGEELTLVAPADQTVRRGETDKVTVMVRRGRFDGAIPLKIENLPKGVEVVEKDVKIPAGSDFGEFTLFAKRDADLVSGHAVRVTASGPQGLAVTQFFKVQVKVD